MHRINTLFIDWNKTLSNSLFWEQMSDESHLYHKYHARIINWLFVDNKDLIIPWMRGKFASEEIVSKMSKTIKLKERIILGELEASCRNMKFLDNRIEEVLTEIKRKGIRLVIATDNMDTFSRFTIPGLKLQELFDDFLVSSEIGQLKEDYEQEKLLFFHNYMTKNGLSYREVVLVDDCIDKTGTYDRLGLKISQVAQGNTAQVLQTYAH